MNVIRMSKPNVKLCYLDVPVNVHLTLHKRHHITDGQPTTCYHGYYGLYIVTKYHFSKDSFWWKWYFHIYILKLPSQFVCPCKIWIWSKHLFIVLKVMLFRSTSGKMAYFPGQAIFRKWRSCKVSFKRSIYLA